MQYTVATSPLPSFMYVFIQLGIYKIPVLCQPSSTIGTDKLQPAGQI